jgi:hypothetical protein
LETLSDVTAAMNGDAGLRAMAKHALLHRFFFVGLLEKLDAVRVGGRRLS